MRGHFMLALLDRLLPEARPDEDFFSAGPPRPDPVVKRLRPQPTGGVRVPAASNHSSNA